MQLVYSFQINKENNKELFDYFCTQCSYSAQLYNQASELLKAGIETKNYENICTLDIKLKNRTEDNFYRKLDKAQTAQQTIKLAQKSWQTFFKSLSAFYKNKHKFTGKPKEPKQVKTFPIIFTNQASSIKNGKIFLTKNLSIFIPQYKKYEQKIKNYKQIRIVPKCNFFNVEIIYDEECINESVNPNKLASIDLGINNLCTLFLEGEHPELISGRKIKSVNRHYNKQKANIKKKQDIKNLFSKQLNRLYRNRENFINDNFHKISRYIVNRLLACGIGTLIVGYNQGWKDSINLGKKNNQKFVCIPYYKLINMLQYKCKMAGLNLILNEESYTSKCDSLSLESIQKHTEYKGKRITRGLFNSSIGKLINADVNGALNILRKCKGDEVFSKILPACLGFLFNPVKIRVA